MAVDSNGTVYVADSGNSRVLSLPAGSTTQTMLPFTGPIEPRGWRWTAPATSTSPTAAGCSNCRVLTALPVADVTDAVTLDQLAGLEVTAYSAPMTGNRPELPGSYRSFEMVNPVVAQ